MNKNVSMENLLGARHRPTYTLPQGPEGGAVPFTDGKPSRRASSACLRCGAGERQGSTEPGCLT